MKTIVTLFIALGLSLPATTIASPHKKIDGSGVGNCVFSKAPLSKGGDADYKLETSFKPGDPVHVRCYFGKSVGEFSRDGKLKNSLRAPLDETVAAQAEGPAWYATITWQDDKAKWWHRTRLNYTPSSQESWEQQRFDMIPGGSRDDCDWTMAKFNKPDDCVEFETETQNLGRNLNKTGTYAAEVCVDVFYEKVDKTRITDDLKEVDVREHGLMARGCFTYTVDL